MQARFFSLVCEKQYDDSILGGSIEPNIFYICNGYGVSTLLSFISDNENREYNEKISCYFYHFGVFAHSIGFRKRLFALFSRLRSRL